MREKITLSTPHMSDEHYEMEYINKAFNSNWIAPVGENIDNFEKEISKYVNSKYAVCLSSGTAAIHMNLKAANVQKGDIVFVQDLTFAATVNPIIYQNAIPVFIDSEKSSYNMCYKCLEKAFKKYPSCKAVVVAHLYGTPANLDKISEICKKYNAVLIEDSAESLGSFYKGKHTGTFGDFGVFSFNGNKIITASSGGAVVTNNKVMAEKIKFWSTQSKENTVYYEHRELGYNYRLSNICAGIGLGQMKVLKDRVKKKTEIYKLYKKEFSDLDFVKMQGVPRNTVPNHWLSALTFNRDVDVFAIIEKLRKFNIESRPIWKPMHLQPFFSKFDYIRCGSASVAEEIFARGICLPSDTKMSLEEQYFVVEHFKNILKKI